MKSVKESIKFRIAEWLDKKYPNTCWSNLVMWSVGYHSFYETFLNKDFSTNFWKYQYCKIREPNNCYCGKCEKQSSVKGELYRKVQHDKGQRLINDCFKSSLSPVKEEE